MTARTSLAIVVASTLAACATSSKEYARKVEQLDAYEIQRPMDEVWPEALKFLHARGYALVGADRKVLGDDPGSWGMYFTVGHETWVQGRRWESETAMDPRFIRYRIRGVATGAKSCRLQFDRIISDDPIHVSTVTPTVTGGGEAVTRDLDLELAFVSTFDPDAAARMSRAADAK